MAHFYRSLSILLLIWCLTGCGKPPVSPARTPAVDEVLSQAVWDNDLSAVKTALEAGRRDDLAFDLAVSRNQVEMVEAFLKHGADPNFSTTPDSTPLGVAAFSGSNEIVDLLLKAGADLQAVDSGGQTVLSTACMSPGNNKTVALLLAAGANPKKADNSGATPLHFCAMFGDAEILNTLLDAGVDVNAVDDSGLTPLMYSTAEGDDDIDKLKLLIKAGADLDARDERGRSALDMSKENSGVAAQKALEEALRR